MELGKTTSVEKLQVVSRFESLRKILLSEQYAEHLDRPLAYWALATDRRLPLAFLARTLRDLLNTPFVDLARTPGVGQMKLASFVRLLARAANTDPASLPAEFAPAGAASPEERVGTSAGRADAFDPAAVSEVVWDHWRIAIVKHELSGEKLGRFAPSLQNMTRVIWNTPLGEYLNYSLGEIRAMKTHGEKRVRAILEVFHSLYTVIAEMGKSPHLAVRIAPKRIDAVEQWVERALQTAGVPSEEEILGSFVEPLLEQIRTDASDQIVRLAEARLGVSGPLTSVRQVARNMGLTRARVYQLLNEINDIMTVRWPNGRHQVYELRHKLESEAMTMDNPPELRRFYAAIELFYPNTRRGASGSVEAMESEEDEQSELVAVD